MDIDIVVQIAVAYAKKIEAWELYYKDQAAEENRLRYEELVDDYQEFVKNQSPKKVKKIEDESFNLLKHFKGE